MSDPIYLDEPQVPVYQSATTTTKTSTKVKELTYGVCAFETSIVDDRSYELALKGNGGGMLLPDLWQVAHNILPKDYRDAENTDDKSYRARDWLDSLNVTLLNKPRHGVIPSFSSHKGINDGVYVPNKDFIGKDRVDFLVSGKDLDGRPFELTVKYYINVVSDTQLQKAIKNDKTYQQAMKKYCSSSTATWRISDSDSVLPINGNKQ